MHTYIPVSDSIVWVGANDRHTQLFEGLWPLPWGVCYNAYVIKDQKTALIDTVKVQTGASLLQKLDLLLEQGRRLDYLVINHMEPDHSGAIKSIQTAYPGVKLVGNSKTVNFLKNFYGITGDIITVNDGDVLDLGRHKLKFFLTPMVHWPETMMTYEVTEKILFAGDAFGGFGALTGGIFDDELDVAFFEDETLRYFSNIVGKYCPMVQRAIAKLSGLDIRIIAPTHGPVWRSNPGHILNLYDRWSRHEAEEGVVLVYGSMYGNTEKMMEAISTGLADEDLSRVRIHNVSSTHVSYLIRDAWRFRGLILGSPTYDTGLFPPMDYFIQLLERKKLQRRALGLFGSFAWSGGGVKTLAKFSQTGNWDVIDPIVEACGQPTPEQLDACRQLGRNVVAKIKAWE